MQLGRHTGHAAHAAPPTAAPQRWQTGIVRLQAAHVVSLMLCGALVPETDVEGLPKHHPCLSEYAACWRVTAAAALDLVSGCCVGVSVNSITYHDDRKK